jgi:hypothetical protein
MIVRREVLVAWRSFHDALTRKLKQACLKIEPGEQSWIIVRTEKVSDDVSVISKRSERQIHFGRNGPELMESTAGFR